MPHDTAAVALENLELRSANERREAERDTFAQRADELESAIHSLVHDLRSPLGAMIGFAELITDDDASAASVRYAETIMRAGMRMTDQIERMLAIYRITNHPLVPELIDMTRVGRQHADELMTQAAGRQLRILVEDGLDAHADPVLTELVLDNLLGNAVKYTSRTPQAEVEMRRVDRGAKLSTFAVRDNGAGFDQADAARLFRPLTRLHTSDEFPGTGLGLASVARIIELHGGTVRAEGERERGATFYFSLPNTA